MPIPGTGTPRTIPPSPPAPNREATPPVIAARCARPAPRGTPAFSRSRPIRHKLNHCRCSERRSGTDHCRDQDSPAPHGLPDPIHLESVLVPGLAKQLPRPPATETRSSKHKAKAALASPISGMAISFSSRKRPRNGKSTPKRNKDEPEVPGHRAMKARSQARRNSWGRRLQV